MCETHWPGASAERVEELVTKNIEKVLASNTKISKIESTSRCNVSIITFSVSDDIKDASQVLDDIAGRLAAIRDLPDGAGPIRYQRDFGDTATLMLTVASPRMSEAEIDFARHPRPRSHRVHPAHWHRTRHHGVLLSAARRFPSRPLGCGQARQLPLRTRCHPRSQAPRRCQLRRRRRERTQVRRGDHGRARHLSPRLLPAVPAANPDVWEPFLVRDLNSTRQKVAAVAGDKYSYRELDDFTDAMEKALMATGRNDVNAPLVAEGDPLRGPAPNRSTSSTPRNVSPLTASSRALSATSCRPATSPSVAGESTAGTKSISLHPSGEFQERTRDQGCHRWRHSHRIPALSARRGRRGSHL
ncbi:MAG: efflux RND transporter permease subunit [Paludibaculum sp.]